MIGRILYRGPNVTAPAASLEIPTFVAWCKWPPYSQGRLVFGEVGLGSGPGGDHARRQFGKLICWYELRSDTLFSHQSPIKMTVGSHLNLRFMLIFLWRLDIWTRIEHRSCSYMKNWSGVRLVWSIHVGIVTDPSLDQNGLGPRPLP